jgi:hypothetical protein
VRETAEGLQILLKYTKDPEFGIAAKHDIIYAASDVEPEMLSEGDRKKLEELDWHWEGENGWYKFV